MSEATTGRRLPRRLIVDPGHYRFAGSSFALEEPGVYRFEDPRGLLEQRLVPGGQLDEFLTTLSWIWSYGTADDGISNRQRLRLARRRRISLTCTPLSDDIAGVLAGSGFPARVVLVFTRDELDDEDNGHTLMEVFDSGRWTLYDPSFRTFFRRDGHRLSLPAWCEAVAERDYEIEALPGGAPALGSFTPDSADLRRRMEEHVASQSARRDWYAHVAGVPLVRLGAHFLFRADDPLALRLRAYSPMYRPTHPDRFLGLWNAEPEF